jgi:hypothetical protein
MRPASNAAWPQLRSPTFAPKYVSAAACTPYALFPKYTVFR